MADLYRVKGRKKSEEFVISSPVHNEHIAAECFRERYHVHPSIIINERTKEQFKVMGACLRCHAVVTDQDESVTVETRLFHSHHAPSEE